MLIVRLRKGPLILFIHITRNRDMDYMTQASIVAKPYINEGWHMIYAEEE